jgi:hypothetical protein
MSDKQFDSPGASSVVPANDSDSQGGTAKNRRRNGGGHFERYNRFVDLGWFAVLPPTQAALWITYNRFANANGVAFPSAATLAKLLGHRNTNHIAAIRKALERHDLLEVIDEGGGRGNCCHVRVKVPKGPVAVAGTEPSSHGSVSSRKHSNDGNQNPPVSDEEHSQTGKETLPISDALYKEQNIEQLKEEHEEQRPGRRHVRADEGSANHIPAPLDTPEFRAVWGDWQQHRREIKKPLTPLAIQKQFKELTLMGPARAVTAINHSIAQGWTGIYEASNWSHGHHAKRHQHNGTIGEGLTLDVHDTIPTGLE